MHPILPPSTATMAYNPNEVHVSDLTCKRKPDEELSGEQDGLDIEYGKKRPHIDSDALIRADQTFPAQMGCVVSLHFRGAAQWDLRICSYRTRRTCLSRGLQLSGSEFVRTNGDDTTVTKWLTSEECTRQYIEHPSTNPPKLYLRNKDSRQVEAN
ncbi:hypothetical protein K469DRAFT_348079 [Zopfia rhizophila CBS 207.26]|uniref:Uncharacterized protein n=1 Tax=Zopfia rhizophila CBS 207.26 TaxID=1314779 RepID=A0A6A6DHW2_9PEZI|nr:hypothetical protein K469DRAFT_348079 [Zopfia rhizophila CBS 207.26]